MTAKATEHDFIQTPKYAMKKTILAEMLMRFLQENGLWVCVELLMAPPQLPRTVKSDTSMCNFVLARQRAAAGYCMHAKDDIAVQEKSPHNEKNLPLRLISNSAGVLEDAENEDIDSKAKFKRIQINMLKMKLQHLVMRKHVARQCQRTYKMKMHWKRATS